MKIIFNPVILKFICASFLEFLYQLIFVNKTPLYNLKDLDLALKAKSEDVAYTDILSAIKFNFKEIEHLCFWDADNYSKINIGNGANYELVLICWEDSQQSQIHKHSENEAFTYVLKGELTEDIFDGGNSASTAGRSIVLNRTDISSLVNKSEKEHRFTNSYGGRSVSLHLYIR